MTLAIVSLVISLILVWVLIPASVWKLIIWALAVAGSLFVAFISILYLLSQSGTV